MGGQEDVDDAIIPVPTGGVRGEEGTVMSEWEGWCEFETEFEFEFEWRVGDAYQSLLLYLSSL